MFCEAEVMIDVLSILNGELLNGIANGGQILDVVLNLTQVSNDQIMKALEIQNKKYLGIILNTNEEQMAQNEKIIQQNEEIIEKLNKILGEKRYDK